MSDSHLNGVEMVTNSPFGREKFVKHGWLGLLLLSCFCFQGNRIRTSVKMERKGQRCIILYVSLVFTPWFCSWSLDAVSNWLSPWLSSRY